MEANYSESGLREPTNGVTTLKVTPSESVIVCACTPEMLQVEGIYAPHGAPPPRHLHPTQDEHFEVLAGAVRVRTPRSECLLTVGDVIDIPRRTAHQIWNDGDVESRLLWQTCPAGRTQEWFEAIDALHGSGRVGPNGMPGPLAFATILNRYRDVFRLAGVSGGLARPVFAVLAIHGRARGF